MAEIHLGGLSIDTEDIDLLVQYCPLADLEKAVKVGGETLSLMLPDDVLRPRFEYRLKSHEIALDIAERTFNEGVEVCRRIDPPEYSITKAIKREYKKPIKKVLRPIE